MQAHLKRILSPPMFEGDEEKTRVAGLLNTILWGTIFLETLRSLSFFFIPNVEIGISLAATAGTLLLAGGLLRLMHTGRVRVASRIFLSLIWLALTGLNALYGGVRGSGYVVYIEVIVAAGLLLGGRGVFAFAAASVLSGIVLYLLEQQGMITPDPNMLRIDIAFGAVTRIFVVVALLIVLYHRSFIRALERARRNEQALAQNNQELAAIQASLEAQVAERTRNAEEARAAAENAQHALEAQMWLVTGLTQLSDIMRGKQRLRPLTDAILQQLCVYLDAPVGAFYLREDAALVLSNSYAYQPPEGKGQRFAMGEGLIGQVASEREAHTLNNITEHSTFTLTSSFGQVLLQHIIVYPVLHTETLVGVIELGRTTPFTDLHLRWLEQALERVAVVITTVQANERIQTLLEETQQQAEELRAQEEELRAANEELAAQAASLRALTQNNDE